MILVVNHPAKHASQLPGAATEIHTISIIVYSTPLSQGSCGIVHDSLKCKWEISS